MVDGSCCWIEIIEAIAYQVLWINKVGKTVSCYRGILSLESQDVYTEPQCSTGLISEGLNVRRKMGGRINKMPTMGDVMENGVVRKAS